MYKRKPEYLQRYESKVRHSKKEGFTVRERDRERSDRGRRDRFDRNDERRGARYTQENRRGYRDEDRNLF